MLIKLDDAERVVHAAIINLCLKDKDTCAGDYSAYALQALRALPVSDGWEDMVEPVARRLCERQIRHVRRHDTDKEWLGANMEECVDYSWQDHIPGARTALEVVFGPLPAPPTIE